MNPNSLHDAAKAGDLAKVKSLLDENPSMANINARNRSGVTPLHYAVEEGHKHIVKLLRQHGALPRIFTTIFWGLRNVFHWIRSR